MDQYTRNQKILWAIGTVVVLFYALVPVAWILSLSLKTPETIGDQSFFPSDVTLDNYSAVFEEGLGFNRALINSIGIALITTVLALAFASMAAYAITRLDFPGKTLILAGALAVSMFPAISVVGGLFNVWRVVGLYDTWPGLILPYLSFALPLSIYTLSAFFREIPWDLEKAAQMDGATRHAGLPARDPAAGHAGRVHGRHPGLHRGLERLPVRERAHVDRRGTHRPGGAVVLPRRLAVHRSVGSDRRRRGGRDDPDPDHGPDLPAANRVRPHLRRGQGVIEDG